MKPKKKDKTSVTGNSASLEGYEKKKRELDKIKAVIIAEIENELKPETKEFRDAMERVCNRILKIPQSAPVQYFKYGETISMPDFVTWFENTQLYYSIGRKFIEQEEGSCCCVDKAFNRYLIPECNKAYQLIKEQGIQSERKRVCEIIDSFDNEENRSCKHIAFFNALELIKNEILAKINSEKTA
jgi:hypothetical protein